MEKFNWESLKSKSFEIFKKYPLPTIILLLGVLILLGGFFLQNGFPLGNSKAEVLDSSSKVSLKNSVIVIQMAGAIEKPGVYHLPPTSRVEDAFIASGGVSVDADRSWVERNINLAAKLSDGQKIFIPQKQSAVLSASNTDTGSNVAQSSNTSDSSSVNINSATLKELDALPGIGLTYAQKIIDNRPYSDIGELLTKEVLGSSLYEKIKSSISVY